MDVFVGGGRVGRLRFALTAAAIAVAAVAGFGVLADRDPFTGEYEATTASLALLGVLAWISAMNVVRRLHDRSHSGLMAAILLVPVLNIGLVVYLFSAPSTPGWNRYGVSGTGGRAAHPQARLEHAAAVNAAARNQRLLTSEGSFDMDGLFRNSEIERS